MPDMRWRGCRWKPFLRCPRQSPVFANGDADRVAVYDFYVSLAGRPLFAGLDQE